MGSANRPFYLKKSSSRQREGGIMILGVVICAAVGIACTVLGFLIWKKVHVTTSRKMLVTR